MEEKGGARWGGRPEWRLRWCGFLQGGGAQLEPRLGTPYPDLSPPAGPGPELRHGRDSGAGERGSGRGPDPADPT